MGGGSGEAGKLKLARFAGWSMALDNPTEKMDDKVGPPFDSVQLVYNYCFTRVDWVVRTIVFDGDINQQT